MRFHSYRLSSLPLLNNNEKGRIIMHSEKRGWSVNEWCDATSIGRTKTFELIGNKSIQSLTVGRRRIITTSPDDFFSERASEKQDRAND